MEKKNINPKLVYCAYQILSDKTQFKRLRELELDKYMVNKYKAIEQMPWSKSSPIRQISTHCSEIKNKLYGHHNDHSYAKDVPTIERVNDDCLAEIFMYLSAFERPKIALVCKQWKRALDYYSWFNVKKIELTYWRYDEYPNLLKKNYPTINEQFSFLKSLLNKCGSYLTELDLTAYGHCNIVPVINKSCPNLVKLRIRIEYINDAILDNAFTHLLKLKVLKIIFQCFKTQDTSIIPVTLIKSLLNVADTLTELNLSNWSGCMRDNTNFPDEITSVVSQLKALKTFQRAGINCPKNLIGLTSSNPKINTTSDDYKYRKNKFTSTEIYKWVTELDLRNFRVTDDFLYNVANVMEGLESLQMISTWITDAGIVAISKMNYLRCLNCCGFNKVTDSSIKLLKNMVLLNLPFSNKITDESAMKVLENSPELIYISVKNTGVTSEFIKKAEEISRNRKQKLKVMILCEDDMPNTRIEYEYLTVGYLEKAKQQNKN